jgi:hypothetical protein
MISISKNNGRIAWLKLSCGFAVLAFLQCTGLAQTLTHRYSLFNEPNGSTVLTDAVAAANGTLKGSAAITGGQLVLSGTSGTYANLPASLISSYSSVTVEAWTDYGTLPANCYLFSFGNTDGGGNGEDYIFCAPQTARITISGVDPGYNSEQNATCASWSGRTDMHVVAVFNPPAGYLALYTNGVLAGVDNSETVPLSSVSGVYSYLGRSLYTTDPYAPIKVDEFRIWKGALNGLQAAADYLAGQTVTNASPGTVTSLQLSATNQMIQGGTQSATVTARAANVPYAVDITRFCTYSSGNTSILTVNPANGLISAVGPGTNTITVQYADVTATQTIVVVQQPSVLTHRYSFFSEPAGSLTATDTIAAANGTLKGTATIAGGQLVLNGTNGTYVNLPGGLINTGYTAVTVETWASFASALPVSFLFGFGNTNGSFGTNYIFCTAQLGRAAITATTYYGEQGITTGGWAGETNLHIVAVFNPPAGYVSLYTNGVLAGIDSAVTTSLAAVNDVESYIGRSLFSGDSYLPAEVTEFRLYNGALNPQQIAVDAASGPSQIITNTGALQSIQLAVNNPMAAGASQTALVTGNFANVTNVNLFTYGSPTITTDNSNVLSIAASGLITAITPGTTANVIASYGGLMATQSVTVAGFATNQFTFTNFGDGFWTVVNQGNGGNLVAGSSGSTQAVATNSATQQQFELLYNLNTSSFRIRQESSWLCLGSLNGARAPGAAVATVASYTAAPSQRWYFVNAGGGYYRIFNAATNLVLQTDNGSPANVTLAPPSTSPYQLWQFDYQTHFPKKGTAGYEGSPYQSELETAWAYNYDDNTGATEPAEFDFVPMIYDATYWEPLSDAQSRDAGWLAQSQPAYLLCCNEPDNASQANLSTNDVISMWPQFEALNLPLVGPGTQNTEDAWENNFYTLIAANNYRVDYAAVHEYVPPNAASLISDCQSVYNAYGHPVWLTEFSPVDWSDCQCWSENDDYNFLAEFMWQAENQSWLMRYSIFPFSNSNADSPWVDNGFTGSVFLSNGQTLSPYGELYATWDADEALHTEIPYLIHNLGTSFRLANTNTLNTPQASTIYTRNSITEWTLLGTPDGNDYIISLNDGRRLSDTNGALGLAPIGTTGTAVEWAFTGPDSSGYYYISNPTGGHNLAGAGTAPAISFSLVSSATENSSTQWRLVKPYQPVTFNTNNPTTPAITFIAAGSGTVSLIWSGGGGVPYFNIYRGTTSGGPYARIATKVTIDDFNDNSVTNGVPYYYVVTAMNLLGEESAYSSEVTATPTSTVSTNLTFAIQGGNSLQLAWPADHIGWRLVMNTNGLANPNWITIAKSAATNQMWLPINPAQTNVFFQLVYP